jgi:acylphosphatase
VVLAGERDAVDALEQWCRQGPPRALVTSVESHPSADDVGPGFRTR